MAEGEFDRDPSSLGDLFKLQCGRLAERPLFLVPDRRGVQTLTYREAFDEVYRYARAIHRFGLKPGERAVIASETCLEWALVDWACQTLGIVLVPVYPTLPPDQAQYIASDCGAKLVFAQDVRQSEKFEGVTTVTMGRELLSTEAELGVDEWNALTASVKPDDTATVIYTSGTTGQPKGAVLTHRGFLDLCAAIKGPYGIGEGDLFLSFLPLSHVFERFAGHVLPVGVGAAVAHAGSVVTLAADMLQVRPTIMCAVPRFFENLRHRVIENAHKEEGLKRKVFDLAMDQAAKKARNRPCPWFWLTDALVGKKIRERTGGRLRFFVSGGAALPAPVADFFVGFGLPILQGYGLTETTAATCLNLPSDNRPWTVGPPIPGVEVKLADDGEILIRGTAVMTGYWGLEEATREAIDPEGWFHSGDIGEFEDGKLKITDRKKDILVLANGKNIAPQKLEALLAELPLVGEAVLFGDGMDHVSAMLVPDFDKVAHWAKENGHPEMDPEASVAFEPLKEHFKSEVQKLNKTLADFEKVKRHVLVPAVFSVESGELTPSLKVKRRFVKEKYKSYVEDLLK
ncbi:MAG: long-chain fatty acid--CoA ligase [Armatimonadetes bacterium]|nr:long-chain fatty acid--CoA ligase [Armatimonadota bacterium]